MGAGWRVALVDLDVEVARPSTFLLGVRQREIAAPVLGWAIVRSSVTTGLHRAKCKFHTHQITDVFVDDEVTVELFLRISDEVVELPFQASDASVERRDSLRRPRLPQESGRVVPTARGGERVSKLVSDQGSESPEAGRVEDPNSKVRWPSELG